MERLLRLGSQEGIINADTPGVATMTDFDLGETLDRLMHERYPVYAEADITIDSHECPPEETTQMVLSAVIDHIAGRKTAVGTSSQNEPLP